MEKHRPAGDAIDSVAYDSAPKRLAGMGADLMRASGRQPHQGQGQLATIDLARREIRFCVTVGLQILAVVVLQQEGVGGLVDDQVAAEMCFRQAIETAQRPQSRAWELRATMSLAWLWQRQGRNDEARGALASVYGTYTEGFTTPDLVDAKKLLKSLA